MIHACSTVYHWYKLVQIVVQWNRTVDVAMLRLLKGTLHNQKKGTAHVDHVQCALLDGLRDCQR